MIKEKVTGIDVAYILPDIDGIHSAALLLVTIQKYDWWGLKKTSQVKKSKMVFGNGHRWFYLEEDFKPCSNYVNSLVAKTVVKERYRSLRENTKELQPKIVEQINQEIISKKED